MQIPNIFYIFRFCDHCSSHFLIMKYLLLTLISFFLFTQSIAQEKKITPLEIGAQAPEFNLPGVDGKSYTLEDFAEYEYLAIVFTCNHCPTAQAYEDKLISIVDKYRPKGVGFVAISPNSPDAVSLSELAYSDLGDDLEDMKLRAEMKKYNLPYLYDGENQKVSIAYGPAATPHVFVFDQERKLVYRGRIDDTENPYIEPKTTDLHNVLTALTSGQAVEVATTKTFGCSIKWAWKNEWIKKQRADWAKEPVSVNEAQLDEIAALLKNNTDELLFVNFWATWCGPCLQEFPDLVSINRMYRERGLSFVSISTDKPGKKEQVVSVLKKMEASNKNLIFHGDIYELIEVVDKEWQGSLPYSAIIAPGGKVLYSVEGTIDPLKVKTVIVEQLGRYYADNE